MGEKTTQTDETEGLARHPCYGCGSYVLKPMRKNDPRRQRGMKTCLSKGHVVLECRNRSCADEWGGLHPWGVLQCQNCGRAWGQQP